MKYFILGIAIGGSILAGIATHLLIDELKDNTPNPQPNEMWVWVYNPIGDPFKIREPYYYKVLAVKGGWVRYWDYDERKVKSCSFQWFKAGNSHKVFTWIKKK